MSETMAKQTSVIINNTDITHKNGHCWNIQLPENVPYGDDEFHKSKIVLLEDNIPLGPAHSLHSDIRSTGQGQYSHWRKYLYFSTSDNSDPRTNNKKYEVLFNPETKSSEIKLFPRLEQFNDMLSGLSFGHYEPSGKDILSRLRLLEAKTEYLLDENYRLKSIVRHLTPQSDFLKKVTQYQLDSFDYQWKNLPYHDESLTNSEWRNISDVDVANRVGVAPNWFKEKKVLECGCGNGRHTWTFARLGADVTAFDMSDYGLKYAKQSCSEIPNAKVLLEKRNILEPLPYDTEFDLVWCYGVIHHTIDPTAALINIAKHVKIGGKLYLMVYFEPRRHSVTDYQYYHEMYALRQATRQMPFDEKSKIAESINGANLANIWFDAISPEINEVYTVEEIALLLATLGFSNVQRTIPWERSHNIIATRISEQK